jgi:hypothetical protein
MFNTVPPFESAIDTDITLRSSSGSKVSLRGCLNERALFFVIAFQRLIVFSFPEDGDMRLVDRE